MSEHRYLSVSSEEETLIVLGNTWNQEILDETSNYRAERPIFKVLSAKVIEEPGFKKHVEYTFSIEMDTVASHGTVLIERRYSEFLNLFLALRKEFPSLKNISFPRKVLVGNFDRAVIKSRATSLTCFLHHVALDEKLRQSPSFVTFLKGNKQCEAYIFMLRHRYHMALPRLEDIFFLFSKIYPMRHPYVIIALCRLVACCAADRNERCVGGRAEKYAELALRRFEFVCDVDLLKYYVPLLKLCVILWRNLGKDHGLLASRLEDLKFCGIQVDGFPTLLEAVLDFDYCAYSEHFTID